MFRDACTLLWRHLTPGSYCDVTWLLQVSVTWWQVTPARYRDVISRDLVIQSFHHQLPSCTQPGKTFPHSLYSTPHPKKTMFWESLISQNLIHHEWQIPEVLLMRSHISASASNVFIAPPETEARFYLWKLKSGKKRVGAVHIWHHPKMVELVGGGSVINRAYPV